MQLKLVGKKLTNTRPERGTYSYPFIKVLSTKGGIELSGKAQTDLKVTEGDYIGFQPIEDESGNKGIAIYRGAKQDGALLNKANKVSSTLAYQALGGNKETIIVYELLTDMAIESDGVIYIPLAKRDVVTKQVRTKKAVNA